MTAVDPRSSARARREGWGPWLLPAAVGMAASAVVTVSGTLAGSGDPRGGLRWAVPPVGDAPDVSLLPVLMAFHGALIVLLRAWWLLLARVRRHRPGATVVVLVGVAWSVPLLLGPPIGSRDVYAYAAQGALVAEGIDPYELGPSALGDDATVAAVDPTWRDAPAPYGPAFLAAVGGLVASVGPDPVARVIGLRLLAVAGVALAVAALPALARRWGADPAEAVAFVLGCPLVLVHLVSGAHNDALLLGLLVAGLAVGDDRRRWRWVLGLALCSVAAAIKVPAVVGVAWLAWRHGGPTARPARRIVDLATAASVALATLALAGGLTGWGWGWVDALLAGPAVDAYLSVAAGVALVGHVVGAVLGVGPPAADLHDVVRLLGLVVAAGGGAVLLWRSPVLGLRALAGALALAALLAPNPQPWYLVWAIGALAVASSGSARRWTVLAVAVLTIFAPPTGPGLGGRVVAAVEPGVIALAVAALVPLTFRAWWRHRPPEVVGPAPSGVSVVVVDDGCRPTPAPPVSSGWREVRRIDRRAEPAALRVAIAGSRGDVVVMVPATVGDPVAAVAAVAAPVLDGTADVAVGARADRSAWAAVVATVLRASFPRRLADLSDPQSEVFAVRRSAVAAEHLRPGSPVTALEVLAARPWLRATERAVVVGPAPRAHRRAVVDGLRQAVHVVELRVRSLPVWRGSPSIA